MNGKIKSDMALVIKSYLKNVKKYSLKLTKETEKFLGKYGGVLFASLFLLYSIALILIYKDLNKGILDILDLKKESIFDFFLAISYFFIGIYFFRVFLLKYANPEGILNKIFSKINGYFLLTLFLIFIVSSVGIQYITLVFVPELPLNTKFISYDGNYYASNFNKTIEEISLVNCDGPHEIFVVNDGIECNFNVTYKINHTAYLSEILIKRRLFNDTYEVLNTKEYYNVRNYSEYDFRIPLENLGNQNYLIEFDFEDEQKDFVQTINSLLFLQFNFDVKSIAENDQRTTRKATYIFGLITLVTITIVSTIRNIKEIMESKK